MMIQVEVPLLFELCYVNDFFRRIFSIDELHYFLVRHLMVFLFTVHSLGVSLAQAHFSFLGRASFLV